jgi:hypothetical protein
MTEWIATFASRLGLRPSLVWLLAGSAVLSAIALLWPSTPSVVAAAVQEGPPLKAPETPAPGDSPRELPARLTVGELGVAQSDPFVASAPPAPVAPPAPKPFVGPLHQPTPPPAPPQYRFVGRLTDPTGRLRYVMGREGRDVLVEQGTALDDGYVVQELTLEAITLRHAGTGTIISLNVPAVAEESRP